MPFSSCKTIIYCRHIHTTIVKYTPPTHIHLFSLLFVFLFFFNDTATTDISPLPLHDPLPIYLPPSFSLHQNYPTPFNPTTTISFDLPGSGVVTLRVFNVLGQQIATLIDHANLDEGEQDVEFDAH